MSPGAILDEELSSKGFAGAITEFNSIHDNPLLTEKWKLQQGSPAIDAGYENGLLLDVFNNSRPSDGNNDGISIIDIGAHEYSEN